MKYTRGEEIVNSITHGLGALFSIVALTIMVIFAVLYGNVWQVVSVSIYGSTLVLLYTMSTLYHAFTNKTVKKVFQVFDHSSIYLLIAGTYTPYTLVVLRECGMKGWIVFSIIWVTAIIGIIISAVFQNKYKMLNMFLYFAMGIGIIFTIPDMINILQAKNAMNGIYFLIAGGISYTIGVIFYSIKKVKYFHSIWHIFVLAGTVFHFISILFSVL